MVVMEQYSELEMLLEVSQHMGVRPAIGIRAKLNTQHAGHWGSTSGGWPQCTWPSLSIDGELALGSLFAQLHRCPPAR